MQTPQIPAMAGMTPLGVKPGNDPNDNYAMYEADRVAKRKAQTACKTFYVQVVPDGSPIQRAEWAWRPWINCDPADKDNGMIAGLAANRFARESGGQIGLKFAVLVADEMPPETGPCVVHQTVVEIKEAR
jgi:hypothetical protein